MSGQQSLWEAAMLRCLENIPSPLTGESEGENVLISLSAVEKEIIITNCGSAAEEESAQEAASAALECLWRFLDGVYTTEALAVP